MSKKKVNKDELLFREKFDEYREIRLYRKNKVFVLERIHGKNAMSKDVYDDPEVAYYNYSYLVQSKSTHFPVNLNNLKLV